MRSAQCAESGKYKVVSSEHLPEQVGLDRSSTLQRHARPRVPALHSALHSTLHSALHSGTPGPVYLPLSGEWYSLWQAVRSERQAMSNEQEAASSE